MYKRINQKNKFNKTVTLEFYLRDDKKIHIDYNGVRCLFTNFFSSVDEADDIYWFVYTEMKKTISR